MMMFMMMMMMMVCQKNLAANPVLHPVFRLLLDLHPDHDDNDYNDQDNNDDENNDGENNDDDDDNDDEDSDDLQARLEWSPSLGAVRYSTVFFFNSFCRSAGSLSLG